MEQPLYLLLGAGILIVIIAAFFLRGARKEGTETLLLHKQLERAEMEKALQRFVAQIKQENDTMLSDLRKGKAETAAELAQLRQSLEKYEQELGQLAKTVKSLEKRSAVKPVVGEEISEAEASEDILALRDRYRRAFELKQEGLDLDEIAKRLGAGRGELELIFSLAAPQERGTNDG